LSKSIISQRSGSFRCYYAPDASLSDLWDALLPEPELLFGQGEAVCSGREGNPRDLVKVRVAGVPYFIKRYNCRGTLYRFKNVFRPSKALRSMRAGQLLSSIGVLTPRPLICLEERHVGLLGRSYLVCPFLVDCPSLLDLWPGLDRDQRRFYLATLGTIMGRMHRANVIHGDSNWRNILVDGDDPGQPRFWFVDLDGFRRYHRLDAHRAERDTGHFLRELLRLGAEREFADLFRDHWRRALTHNRGEC
jgi:hypothetical protein